jgi:hypothetical protein
MVALRAQQTRWGAHRVPLHAPGLRSTAVPKAQRLLRKPEQRLPQWCRLGRRPTPQNRAQKLKKRGFEPIQTDEPITGTDVTPVLRRGILCMMIVAAAQPRTCQQAFCIRGVGII